MKTCFDLELTINHCDSCHQDYDEFGYDLPEISINGEPYQVCCAVLNQGRERVEL